MLVVQQEPNLNLVPNIKCLASSLWYKFLNIFIFMNYNSEMSDYSFSFEKKGDAERVAIITKDSQKHAGESIYLNKEKVDYKDKENDKLDLLFDYCKTMILKQEDFDELAESVATNEPPSTHKLKVIYNKFRQYLRKTSEISLPDSELEVVPMIGDDMVKKKSRQTILVNGANNSGKSYWVGRYANKWQKIFPKSPIYILSNKPLKDEPEFKHLKRVNEIPLVEEYLNEIIYDGEPPVKEDKRKKKKEVVIIEQPQYNDDGEEIEEDELKRGYAPYQYFKSSSGQSLLIIDDFEGGNPKIEKMVRQIIDSVLMVGRSSRIYCIIVSHELSGGKKTKTINSEVDAFVFFPRGITPYSLRYALVNYTSMNSNQISKVVDANSRWVFINKVIPCYVIEQHKMWLF